MRDFLAFLNRSSVAQIFVTVSILAPCLMFLLWVVMEPWTGLDRRQFMWDCVAARGISHQQQCAAEFPAVEAARYGNWTVRR